MDAFEGFPTEKLPGWKVSPMALGWRAGAAIIRLHGKAIAIYLVGLGLFLGGRLAACYLAPERFELLPWDSSWYAGIVDFGYHYNGDPQIQQNVAFFPLFPMLGGLVKVIFGLSTAHSLLLTAFTLSLVTAVMLYQIFAKVCGLANPGIALLFFFTNPFSLFLFSGYAESAWICTIVLAIYFLEIKKNYLVSTIFINLASLSRPYGILVAAILFIFLARRVWSLYRVEKQPTVARVELKNLFIFLPLTAVAMLSYLIYLGIKFHDPLAFFHVQSAWHKDLSLPLSQLFHLNFLKYIVRALIMQIPGRNITLASPIWWDALAALLCFSWLLAFAIDSIYHRTFDIDSIIAPALLINLFLWYFSRHEPWVAVVNAGRYFLPVYLGVLTWLFKSIKLNENIIIRNRSSKGGRGPPE
ncbi:MAG: hypothetical protein HQK59_04960 [Deltaproteobacteria bacterium]|nr:hypothetical protein [Deltaproteobacteria bacterium]